MRHQVAALWPAGGCLALGAPLFSPTVPLWLCRWGVSTGVSPGTRLPPRMGPRCLWGWRLLGSLSVLFSLALFGGLLLLLFLTEDAQKMGQASARLHAAQREPSGIAGSGTATLAHEGVDFVSLFQGNSPDAHCELGQMLLILVASASGNAEARQVIRRTWAAQAWPPPYYLWQVVFLVGQSPTKRAARQVQQEQREFGDILLGGYLDTYRNLTLKVLHGLKWAVEHCQPSFILKTDDDCFVNTDRLPEFLARRSPSERSLLYAGSLFPREKRQVIRHPASKWYVSREDYSPSEYPPYASGIGYLLSLGAARLVLRVAEQVRPVPVEDAYVGILAQRAGLRLSSSARFAKQNARWHLCNYRYLFVIHHLSAGEQEAATRSMREAHTACRGNPEVSRWK
ncbi:hypothetical protein JD844_015314 [Phrynosoma platyrhinos]|uniref:Hexosyltransferase n=1 Tax=Phrynosoma platyrhinos TaxID=52577 RepID=A0ABQ7SIY9_PHRPL|nr:hypothetical protein JD844_015314 [Phrynosoma platyrhinos]